MSVSCVKGRERDTLVPLSVRPPHGPSRFASDPDAFSGQGL